MYLSLQTNVCRYRVYFSLHCDHIRHRFAFANAAQTACSVLSHTRNIIFITYFSFFTLDGCCSFKKCSFNFCFAVKRSEGQNDRVSGIRRKLVKSVFRSSVNSTTERGSTAGSWRRHGGTWQVHAGEHGPCRLGQTLPLSSWEGRLRTRGQKIILWRKLFLHGSESVFSCSRAEVTESSSASREL